MTAPWPTLRHLQLGAFPYWEIKIAIFVGALTFLALFYWWYVFNGWKAIHFAVFRWIGYCIYSVPPLIIAFICAIQGAQMYLLGISLIFGWLVCFFYFFVRRYLVWDAFYLAMLKRNKINAESGQFSPEIGFPSLNDALGNKGRSGVSSGLELIVIFAVMGSALSGSLYSQMKDQPEVMNAIWIIIHYMVSILTIMMPSVFLFDILAIKRWEKENGKTSYIAALTKF